jgi:hypothetical protein
VLVCGSTLYAGQLGHRRGRKIRQEASFDHGAASDILEISAITFHFPFNLAVNPSRCMVPIAFSVCTSYMIDG